MNRNYDNRTVIQALNSAESAIRLAKQLVSGQNSQRPAQGNKERDFSNLPYVDGTFDGTHMVDSSGKRYEVSTNYATKSELIYGDKLRAYDDKGRYWFKQTEKTPREKLSGMLTQKSGVWHVVTGDGSYKVASNAVDYLGYKLDDEVDIFLPAGNKRVPFATLRFDPKKRDAKKAEEQKQDQAKSDTTNVVAPESTVRVSLEVAESLEKKKETKEKDSAEKKEVSVKKEPVAEKDTKVEKGVKAEAAPKKEEASKKEVKKDDKVKVEEKTEEKVVLEEDDLR